MSNNLKPPLLSTSFSESGKNAKKRFENIFNSNKKKNCAGMLSLFICLTFLCGTLVSCNGSSIGIIGGADGPTSVLLSSEDEKIADKLFDAQSKYIGNASATGKIIGLFTPPSGFSYDEAGLMELQTSKEPFGLTINYKITDRNAAVSEDAVQTDEFEKQAVIILTLIENLGSVTYNIKDNSADGEITYSKTFTKTEAEARLGRPLSDYRASRELFSELFNNLFITYSPKDSGIAAAILNNGAKNYLDGEISAEGHIILGEEANPENPEETIIYALTTYGNYGFENNTLVKISGTGIIPAKVTLDKDMTPIEYITPKDGSLYLPSLKEMFPEEYYRRALDDNKYNEDYNACLAQEFKYAAEYLHSIGREASIKDQIENKQYLNISPENSNALATDKFSKYPSWIGTKEALENGIRVVYETKWDQNSGELATPLAEGSGILTFTKYRYDTGEILETEVLQIDNENGIQILPLS